MHVLGQSRDKNRDLFSYNSDIVKRENSVILLEDDYSTKYQGFDPNDPESFIFFNLMSNAFYEQSLIFAQFVHEELGKGPIKGDRGVWQDPFYVLWKTTMPASLIEIGFISNKSDLAVMRSEHGRDQIAEGLLRAFGKYKAYYDKSVDYQSAGSSTSRANDIDPDTRTQSVKEQNIRPQTAAESAKVPADTYFGVQVMTLGRKLAANDPAFKGWAHRAVPAGKVYKYIIGISSDVATARKCRDEVAGTFPGSFLVKVEGGNVQRIN